MPAARFACQVAVWIDQVLRLATVERRQHDCSDLRSPTSRAMEFLCQVMRQVQDHFRIAGRLRELFERDELPCFRKNGQVDTLLGMAMLESSDVEETDCGRVG